MGGGLNNPPASISNFADLSDVQKVVKSSDGDPVNNSTTLVNDPELYFAVGANEIWAFEAWILADGESTPDLKVTFTVPTAGTLYWHFDDKWSSTISTVMLGAGVSYDKDTSSAGNVVACNPKGIYVGGANAGNIRLQWAQNVANASDTKVLANSFIIAHRLG